MRSVHFLLLGLALLCAVATTSAIQSTDLAITRRNNLNVEVTTPVLEGDTGDTGTAHRFVVARDGNNPDETATIQRPAAYSADDYVLEIIGVGATLTYTSGRNYELKFTGTDAQAIINCRIIGDEKIEQDKDIVLTMTGFGGGASDLLANNNDASLRLNDNDIQVTISVNNAAITESATQVVYTVTKNSGSTAAGQDLSLALTASGSADDADFSNVGGTAGFTSLPRTAQAFTFPATSTGRSISVTVVDDTEVESTETLQLAVSEGAGGAVSGYNIVFGSSESALSTTATLAISDNDVAPSSTGSNGNGGGLGNDLINNSTGTVNNTIPAGESSSSSSSTGVVELPSSSGPSTPNNPNTPNTPTPPTVTRIIRVDAAARLVSQALELDFLVDFSQKVDNVQVGDFIVKIPPQGLTAGVKSVTRGDGTAWLVTVGNVAGSGAVGLILIDRDTITLSSDGSVTLDGTGITNLANPTFQTSVVTDFVLEAVAPVVEGIQTIRTAVLPESQDPLTWLVTFSEKVYGLAPSNFVISGPGVTSSIITVQVKDNDRKQWTVSANVDVSATTVVGLALSTAEGIVDVARNVLDLTQGTVDETFKGQSYTVVVSDGSEDDTDAPAVVITTTISSDISNWSAAKTAQFAFLQQQLIKTHSLFAALANRDTVTIKVKGKATAGSVIIETYVSVAGGPSASFTNSVALVFQKTPEAEQQQAYDDTARNERVEEVPVSGSKPSQPIEEDPNNPDPNNNSNNNSDNTNVNAAGSVFGSVPAAVMFATLSCLFMLA